jgi:hypothetical protein
MRKRHCGLALRRLIIRALRRVFIGIGLPYCRTPSPPFGYGLRMRPSSRSEAPSEPCVSQIAANPNVSDRRKRTPQNTLSAHLPGWQIPIPRPGRMRLQHAVVHHHPNPVRLRPPRRLVVADALL